MNIHDSTIVLKKSLIQISKHLGFDSKIEITEVYIEQFHSNSSGVFVKLNKSDEAGMFISVRDTHKIEYSVFLPKYDEGDSSVGLSERFYNSFDEGEPRDFFTTDVAVISISSFLSLVELYLKFEIDSLVESEYENLAINNYSDLLKFWCAEDFSNLKRHVYKYTNCGAWIVLIDNKNKTYSECDNDIEEEFLIQNIIGFKISSIIEGSDVELEPYVLKFPLEKSKLENTIKELESECEYYWKRDNLDNWE